jgi:hypothetical protein
LAKFENSPSCIDVEESSLQKMKHIAYPFGALSAIMAGLLLFLSTGAALLTSLLTIPYMGYLAYAYNTAKERELPVIDANNYGKKLVGTLIGWVLWFIISAVVHNADIAKRAELLAGQNAEKEKIAAEVATLDTQARSEEPEAPTIRVSAEELYSAFEANEAGAQMKYGKSTLIVSGEIESITLDLFDEPVINLVTSNMFSSVSLNDVDNEIAASLFKGQYIEAKCTRLTEAMGSPQLSGCSIL